MVSQNSLIRFEDLSYSIPHGKQILDKINFQVFEKEFVGLLGKNGAGKTTLLEILIGLRTPTKGKMDVLNNLKLTENCSEDLILISHDITLKKEITIKQFFEIQSLMYSKYSKKIEQILSEEFEVDPSQLIGSLSTGQQRKLQIISAISSRPKILLIDELTAVLDPEARHLLFHALKEAQKSYGLSILLATNIAEDLEGKADKVLFLKNKTITQCLPSEIKNLFKVAKK